MFKNIFKRKTKMIMVDLFSPIYGEVISLSEVPDPVFAQKMMGDGLAFIPKDGKVVSPVSGKIVRIFPTKHAIVILTENELEILIHLGLDTVELNGKGYEVFVNEGQQIKVGDPLMNVDLELLEKYNKEIVTPMTITNSEEKVDQIELRKKGEIHRGEYVLKCYVR